MARTVVLPSEEAKVKRSGKIVGARSKLLYVAVKKALTEKQKNTKIKRYGNFVTHVKNIRLNRKSIANYVRRIDYNDSRSL